MSVAVLVPGAPLLLAGVGGRLDPGAALRRICQDTIRAAMAGIRSAAAGPEVAMIVAGGPQDRDWPGHPDQAGQRDERDLVLDRLTGRSRAAVPTAPLGIAVGRALLEGAGWTGTVRAHTTTGDLAPDLTEDAPSLIVVVGDGSALRRAGGPAAPDPRAMSFDAELLSAVTDGDTERLLALSPDLAAELMVTGLPAWRWLAQQPAGRAVRADVDYADDPFGVFALVARWSW